MRAPERFGGVDVSKAGHEFLVEQCRLDRTAALEERLTERCGGPAAISGVGAQSQHELRAGRMDVERAEGTRIDEHETGAALEIDDRARKTWQLISDRPCAQSPFMRKCTRTTRPSSRWSS